ncbi:MAG: hypothetical protein GXO85_13090, partial [Chlorobi bacterium]|nr:hypothetical protein [Chlorobiota bacterium]
ATLVNKQQKPGNYEVKFDASNLPAGRHGLTSGLYFYRITSTPSGGQAGSFIKTMKMILLK